MALATSTLTKADLLYSAALEQIASGDRRGAAGTLWEASAQAFEALARRRGWQVDPHRHYEDVLENAKKEIVGSRLSDGMSAAVLMECNWLDDYELSESWLRSSAREIRDMIDVLQDL